jgi:ubiquinone/menaquinone biosynthesis C-methylase UbiE
VAEKMMLDIDRNKARSSKDEYHQNELNIALDSNNFANFLPRIRVGEKVLDIGCGAGQTLIAVCPPRLKGEGGGCVTCARTDDACHGWACGVDIDQDALRLGRAWSDVLHLQHASAEHLPYNDKQFDIVISRVCLYLVDMQAALSEIRRVLRPGGRIWFTLHRFSMVRQQLTGKNWRGRIFLTYVVLNGLLFHLTLRTLALFNRREYWQTSSAMRRVLKKYQFEKINCAIKGNTLIVSASLGVSLEEA